MVEIDKIYNEDCLATIGKMDNDFLDLTITSVPYNVDLGNNKFNKNLYDLYNDNKKHWEYISWLKEVFAKIYEKTKSGARCIINVGDGKNGAIPSHSDIIQFMKGISWIPMTTIIWDKGNVSSRTAWGSFMSPSSPSFPTPFEYILVFAKNDKKLQNTGETDLTKEEFIEWSLAKWSFPGENLKKIGHPAAYPIELPKRCIKMFSWIGATVYDPFSGSGTTAFACKALNRHYIGSEISEQYCLLAKNRLEGVLF